MNATSTRPPPASPLNDQGVHVSAYVDLALDAVFDRLASPSGAELLAAAIRAALGDEGDVTVQAVATDPVWVSASHARLPVTWSVTGASGSVTEGAATISLLMVQSGHDAITELLVIVPTPDVRTGRSNAVLHEVLYELAIRLETYAA